MENKTVEELLEYVKQAVEDVRHGEVFLVRDLFQGIIWNRIYSSTKIRLGSAFLFYARTDGAGIIMPLSKTPSNQQRYQRL